MLPIFFNVHATFHERLVQPSLVSFPLPAQINWAHFPEALDMIWENDVNKAFPEATKRKKMLDETKKFSDTIIIQLSWTSTSLGPHAATPSKKKPPGQSIVQVQRVGVGPRPRFYLHDLRRRKSGCFCLAQGREKLYRWIVDRSGQNYQENPNRITYRRPLPL